MKGLKQYILSALVGLLSVNSAQAFEIGGVALGAELHYTEFEDYS